MKSYIITIIGATLLGAIGSMLTPDTMRKYVSVITGFIIISVIISPLASLRNIDIFSSLKSPARGEGKYEEIYAASVSEALVEKIQGDIKQRIRDEFSLECAADVILAVERGDIKEISQISIRGIGAQKRVAARLMEVYNVKEVIMDGQKFSLEISEKQE